MAHDFTYCDSICVFQQRSEVKKSQEIIHELDHSMTYQAMQSKYILAWGSQINTVLHIFLSIYMQMCYKLMLSDGKQSECEKRLSIKLETQPFRTLSRPQCT